MEAGKTVSKLQRGVTLIECCIVLVVAGILAGLSGPSFVDANRKRALEAVAAEVAGDLQFARSAATAHQEGVRFAIQGSAGASCLIVHTGAAGACTCDGNGAVQCAADAKLLKTSLFHDVSASANVASIRFDPTHGRATPAGTVRLASGGQALHHVVNIQGRVRTCSPAASVKGYKPC